MSDVTAVKSAPSLQNKGKIGKNRHKKTLCEDGPHNTAENGKRNIRGKPNFRFDGSQEMMKTSEGDENSAEWKRKRKDDSTLHSFKVPHRDSSISSRSSSNASQDSPQRKKHPRKPVEIETDPVILARRQKQIDYGKNTVGYDLYRKAVPKEKRERNHPRTPPKHIKYSRRSWDTMVKIWRQKLHCWDNEERIKTEPSIDSPEECNSDSVNKSATTSCAENAENEKIRSEGNSEETNTSSDSDEYSF